jgi:GT2 family glycosyltransferase
LLSAKQGLEMIEILMTIKDRQDFLDRQLDYLRPHLSPDIVLTVYDDGSEVPLYLSGDTSNIRIIRSEVNLGLIEARNRLLNISYNISKYVLFLDDDIFIYGFEKFIERAKRELEEDEKLLAVSCPYINLPSVKYGAISTFKKIYEFDKSDSSYVVYFFGGTSLFDRESLIQIGGLEGKYFIYLEEEDLALRSFLNSKYFKILYGYDFIAIHDQAPGKDFKQRNVYLLSNRFLFHYKFIKNPIFVNLLNFIYIIIYLVKTRSFKTVLASLLRYRTVRHSFVRHDLSIRLLTKFFKMRFF